MTSRDFAYWLQGLFELSEVKTLNKKQTELIKKHLNMVFYHEIDPSYGEDQEGLDKIHNPEQCKQEVRGAVVSGLKIGDDFRMEIDNPTTSPKGGFRHDHMTKINC